MLALKIFSDTPADLASAIVDRTISDNLGLEVLLITPSGHKVDLASVSGWDSTLLAPISHKTLHMNHHGSEGWRILEPEVRYSVLADISDMHSLGITKGVMHYHHEFPLEQRRKEALAKNLVELNCIAEDNAVTFFLENTLVQDGKVSITLYWDILTIIQQRNLANLGFCFDIGHAKAFSDTTLPGWLQLLDYAKESRIPLHFHLHNNDGTADNHLSFRKAELKGLNQGDTFTGGMPYMDVVAHILKTYSGLKLLEVGANEAIPGLDWTQAQLARLA